jgi:hypothetical protein
VKSKRGRGFKGRGMRRRKKKIREGGAKVEKKYHMICKKIRQKPIQEEKTEGKGRGGDGAEVKARGDR